MTNQAISRRTFVSTLTFASKPTEETRKALIDAGYQFDAKSRQWYRRDEEAGVVSEEQIARDIGVAA